MSFIIFGRVEFIKNVFVPQILFFTTPGILYLSIWKAEGLYDIKVEFVNRYVQSFEMITGTKFQPIIEGSIVERIKKSLGI